MSYFQFVFHILYITKLARSFLYRSFCVTFEMCVQLLYNVALRIVDKVGCTIIHKHVFIDPYQVKVHV